MFEKDDHVWVIWTCEGNVFERKMDPSEAAARVAELRRDETVTEVHTVSSSTSKFLRG